MNEVKQYTNYLMHFGRSKRNGAPGRGSGRYPLGSGKEPYQYRDRKDPYQYRDRNGTIKPEGLKKLSSVFEDGKKSLDKTKLNRTVRTLRLEPKYKNDITIKKGSVVYRLSSTKEEEHHGPAYVFFTDSDFDLFSNLEMLSNDKHYKNAYEVKKDIKIPSMEVVAKTYINTILKDTNILDSVVDYFFGYKHSKYKHDDSMRQMKYTDPKKFIKKYSKKSIDEFCDEVKENVYDSAYKYVAYELCGTQSTMSKNAKSIINSLRKQGYDAIPDFNDSAALLDGDKYSKDGLETFPLFLFDRAEVLNRKKTIDIFEEEHGGIDYNTKYARPEFNYSGIDDDGKLKIFDQNGREYVKKKIKQ